MRQKARGAKRAHMGDRLETLLRERGWTQAELGRRLKARGIGWSRQDLSVKVGQETWRADTIWAIAQAAGVPTDYFFMPVTLPGKV